MQRDSTVVVVSLRVPTQSSAADDVGCGDPGVDTQGDEGVADVGILLVIEDEGDCLGRQHELLGRRNPIPPRSRPLGMVRTGSGRPWHVAVLIGVPP